jgi:hypothetical protein
VGSFCASAGKAPHRLAMAMIEMPDLIFMSIPLADCFVC